MADYEAISCSDHDMLEIACLDRYEVRVQLAGAAITGIASDLETRGGQEFLRLRTAAGQEEQVRADRIRTLTVLTRPARFEKHDFAR